MRVDVLRRDRFRRAGSVALLVVTGIVSGCSSDVARFDDGFYTGAVPQQPVPRAGMSAPAAQAYPTGLDSAETGSIGQGGLPAYGNNPGAGVRQGSYSPTNGASGGYGQAPVTRTASVERTMLAPPSGSQAYPAASAPQPTYQQPAPVQAAPAPSAAQAARPPGQAA
ncbi:MAG: hypothetical protein H7Y08_11965, partial [Rhizobiaceae bacterium]|nr:hypothetical protein [Rhizobiaceae bacterium]